MGYFYIFMYLPSSKKGKNVSATATLSAKFQISIPRAVREKQDREAG